MEIAKIIENTAKNNNMRTQDFVNSVLVNFIYYQDYKIGIQKDTSKYYARIFNPKGELCVELFAAQFLTAYALSIHAVETLEFNQAHFLQY